MEKNKLIASSSNPQDLSLTIKGLLIGLPAILIAIFRALNVEVTESQIMEIVQNVNIVIAVTISTIGAMRKVWNAIRDAFNF